MVSKKEKEKKDRRASSAPVPDEIPRRSPNSRKDRGSTPRRGSLDRGDQDSDLKPDPAKTDIATNRKKPVSSPRSFPKPKPEKSEKGKKPERSMEKSIDKCRSIDKSGRSGKSRPGWFHRLNMRTGDSENKEKSKDLDKRRSAILAKTKELKVVKKKMKSATKAKEDEEENFPFEKETGEPKSEKSQDVGLTNPFAASKLIAETASVSAAAAAKDELEASTAVEDKKLSLPQEWDPWGSSAENLEKRDSEFDDAVVKANTAVNLAMCQKADDDDVPGHISATKRPAPRNILVSIFRRRNRTRVKMTPGHTRTEITTDAQGRATKEETTVLPTRNAHLKPAPPPPPPPPTPPSPPPQSSKTSTTTTTPSQQPPKPSTTTTAPSQSSKASTTTSPQTPKPSPQ